MQDQAPEAQAREFAAAFRSFLDWIHSTPRDGQSQVTALIADFLGPDAAAHSVVSRELPAFEHVNLVLEDVDLVAEDRSMGPRSSPVLFDLLDAMDGAAPDADLLFLLTTNRADLLKPALAARPGRVDVAVEIDLPDADARERLLTLYGRSLSLALTQEDIATAVERTDGTTASFLKELIRRSVLEALRDDPALPAVTVAHGARGLGD